MAQEKERRKRSVDRYFEGFVTETVLKENGKEKKVYVYKGEYFRLNKTDDEVRRLKIALTVLTAAFTAIFIGSAMLPVGATTQAFYVAGVQITIMLPLLFLLIGLGLFLAHKGDYIVREKANIVQRMQRSILGCLALSAATLVLDVVYLILNFSQVTGEPLEFVFLLGTAACVGISVVMYRMVRDLDFVTVNK